MNKRHLSLALVIAAGIAPVIGCDSESTDQSAQTVAPDTSNRAVESAGDNSGQELPIDGAQAAETAPDEQDGPSLADQLDALRQQVKAQQQEAEQRRAKQARRIDTLEKTVEQLKTRLRRLPQATANKKSSSPAGHPVASSPASESAASKPAIDRGDRGKSQQVTQPTAQDAGGATVGNDEDKTDSQSGDTRATTAATDDADDEEAGPEPVKPTRSPPASPDASASRDPCDPASGRDFDVFYAGDTRGALDAAARKVKSVGLTDWFASTNRLYVGRYGTCPLAENRRDDVNARTGLELRIAAVGSDASGSARVASTDDHYGRNDRPVRSDDRRNAPATPTGSQTLPFTIVGVEIRGSHRTLGVAPQDAKKLSDITWLSPGQTFQGWRLTRIQPDNRSATFAVDGRAVNVALPSRG